MKRVFDHIRDRLYERAGYFDRPMGAIPPPDRLYQTEWCLDFERLMRRRASPRWHPKFIKLMHHRLMMGAFRYGLLVDKHMHGYLYFRYAELKMVSYTSAGNLECLVDVANMAMLEYFSPSHPHAHWADLHLLCVDTRLDEILPLYAINGNLAWLVAVAVAAMFEFTRPRRPGTHWSPDSSPGRKVPV